MQTDDSAVRGAGCTAATFILPAAPFRQAVHAAGDEQVSPYRLHAGTGSGDVYRQSGERHRPAKLGTPQAGAPGDATLLDLVEGPMSFGDTRNNTQQGSRYLKPVYAVRAGRLFGRPPYFVPSALP